MLEQILSLKGAAFVVALLSCIQIAPIKINPWSWILKVIGREMNGEVIHKVGNLEKAVHDIKNRIEEDKAVTARVRILRFNDELLEGKLHTKDSFDQCLSDIDNYERYCVEHPNFKNNMTMMSIGNIKRVYANCLEQRDFVDGAACRIGGFK